MKIVGFENWKISKLDVDDGHKTYQEYSRRVNNNVGTGIDSNNISTIRTGNLSVFSYKISNRNIPILEVQKQSDIDKTRKNLLIIFMMRIIV
jgi:hypothetical protein